MRWHALHAGLELRRPRARDSFGGTMPTDREILAAVRSIPRGHVTTYGDLCPGAPRRAGAVLAANDDPALPWQRVVRADGSLAKGERQRALLEAEQVPFRGARVDMRAAWVPPAAPSGRDG